MKLQRMFSNVGEEKLYSTGNDELDDLLERAFCEGYEYAQKEFATGLDKLAMKSAQGIIKMGQGNGKQAARIMNAGNKRFAGNSMEKVTEFGKRAALRNKKEAEGLVKAANKVNPTTAKKGVTETLKNLGPDRAHKLKGYQQKRMAGLI
jgi:hypothetical protein